MNRFYLLYGPTAVLETFIKKLQNDDADGYDSTNIVATSGTGMAWVAERLADSGLPPGLPQNLTCLGSRYDEIWKHEAKLSIYNSIYPPDETGSPRAFAAFAGCEEEMGL